MQNLPIFPVFSRFSRFPRLSHFCADFGGGLKKNGISCSKDDYLCINYIVLALIWVVIHIFTICGSKVMEFWKFVGIFGKSGQNRGKIIFLQTVPCLLAGGSSLRSFAYRAWSLTWFSYSIKQNARKQINLMVFSRDFNFYSVDWILRVVFFLNFL